ncbi:Isovaleryl-homoserine lactone synthase [Variovorax sp. PBS-H4]|uniref:acyl-homoserine-lactone synthase n=1 Tax=Variovorax sp. PBS-H4 TaxID=434008 RepID=UPI0013182067|nr:acyl-homoserine-lactone synthase [Variovorax sp. PBS-H4]VTU40817.1 Isovaleryl-homoserine lactone synthase [Variovorax sp. PBS-H4]
MEFTTGTSHDLPEEVLVGLARYRHKVFVETLGWDLSTQAGLELDQFDRPDTLYVAARDKGRYIGVARLLPTVRPYLLGEVFPQLMGDAPPPQSAEVWELSRFAAIDFHSNVLSGPFSSPTTVGLLKAVQSCALRHGASRLITTLSSPGIERLLQKLGFLAYRAGPPQIINGHPLFACWIELNNTSNARS